MQHTGQGDVGNEAAAAKQQSAILAARHGLSNKARHSRFIPALHWREFLSYHLSRERDGASYREQETP
jgi:hypothetical protein